jgi:ATP-dependent helicase/nuclease subunit B
MTNIYTIPSGVDFIRALATELWRSSRQAPFELADMQIYLPTRRACLLLRDAFLALMDGGATLLPRMQPMGDVDDAEFYFASDAIDFNIPPALSPLRRQLLLTRLIQKRDAALSPDQAAQLAVALARFLDEVQISGVDTRNLPALVDRDDLARHWQDTVAFLDIIVAQWPLILAEEGCIDPAGYRNRIMQTQIRAWTESPPTTRIIAAGSTGSMPTTADFLQAVASLPNGQVILPGLDRTMDETIWQAVGDDHPHHAMKVLLAKMNIAHSAVQLWPCDDQPASVARRILLREAMRPASVSEQWRTLTQNDITPEALHGLSRLELDHTQEEAQAIALMMRATLETADKTATLVTPDRQLAERVACLLLRWNVDVNDSGGMAMTNRPIGSFLMSVLSVAEPEAGAVATLSLLKHPLAGCGLSLAECRSNARAIEVNVWRTDRPEQSAWLPTFQHMLSPLTNAWQHKRPFIEWLNDHIAVTEILAATDTETGADRLWLADDGEQAATWISELRQAARDFSPITGDDYAPLFGELLASVTYRPHRSTHPRLSILGLLEARLVRADTVILGGLNEGSWPPEAPIDPWMSRPMRKKFGLPAPEYRVGLAAHDFAQLVSTPNVILTRARRSGGTPTVPSRFVLQLETVLRAVGIAPEQLTPDTPWREWTRQLDKPDADTIRPCPPPEPRPTTGLRPTTLSVTDIGLWLRNPYAIYAKHILKLRRLNDLEAAPDASDRGSLIHNALEEFCTLYPRQLPNDALHQLLTIGRKYFSQLADNPEVAAFWWPRFETIAEWFVAYDGARRDNGVVLLKAEASGQILLDDFILKGRADRLDSLPDGTLAIIDYKTGAVPKDKDVEAGLEPQLPLLALIAAQGGFEAVKAAITSELRYWKLSGGRDVAKDVEIDTDIAALIEAADAGLRDLINKFTNPDTPYQAVPRPAYAPRYDDYAHLARLKEWGRSLAES